MMERESSDLEAVLSSAPSSSPTISFAQVAENAKKAILASERDEVEMTRHNTDLYTQGFKDLLERMGWLWGDTIYVFMKQLAHTSDKKIHILPPVVWTFARLKDLPGVLDYFSHNRRSKPRNLQVRFLHYILHPFLAQCCMNFPPAKYNYYGKIFFSSLG